jgi:predicted HicB family RNase H-like nuclease
MTELRLIVERDLAERLASAAAAHGISTETFAADVICRHVSAAAEADRRLADEEDKR